MLHIFDAINKLSGEVKSLFDSLASRLDALEKRTAPIIEEYDAFLGSAKCAPLEDFKPSVLPPGAYKQMPTLEELKAQGHNLEDPLCALQDVYEGVTPCRDLPDIQPEPKPPEEPPKE